MRYTPDTEALWHLRGSLRPQKILEVAVFGENVSEGLVHDFICGGLEESCILVDLLGCGLVEADRSGYLVGLNNLKQWHLILLSMCDYGVG
jgi:hypothetical protein